MRMFATVNVLVRPSMDKPGGGLSDIHTKALDLAEGWHRRPDRVGDIGRRHVAIMLFYHPRIRVPQVAGYDP